MAANAEIFEERDDWRHPLALSVAFHAFLFGGILLYSAIMGGVGGESWGGGGGGGAISATLVSTVPLPASAPETQNVLANESKGVSQSLPKAKPEPAPEAIPIPSRDARKTREARVRTPTREPAKPVEAPTNVVPFGQGGPVSGPYGMFTAGGAKGGFGFTGSGGDFGSRFAWYVDVVRKKISENWLKYEVDPRISASPNRVYITFEIARDGHPSNIQIEQSSGIPSLDQSAFRAVQRIDTFGPLPGEYAGNRVSVEFWFDYRH